MKLLLTVQICVWGSFLCIFALATVASSSVFTYFPDCGDLRDRVLFNSKIEPQDTALFRDFHVLLCMQGSSAILCGNSFVVEPLRRVGGVSIWT